MTYLIYNIDYIKFFNRLLLGGVRRILVVTILRLILLTLIWIVIITKTT